MLQRSERIKYSGLFTQAFQKGKKLHSQNLTLVFTVTRENLKDRLPLTGFVISKTYSKKAVERNRIKRQLREIYRLYRLKSANQEKLKNIGLLVFKVNSSKAFDDYFLLEKELLVLLSKI
jgi:ribonuclease P protein component